MIISFGSSSTSLVKNPIGMYKMDSLVKQLLSTKL